MKFTAAACGKMEASIGDAKSNGVVFTVVSCDYQNGVCIAGEGGRYGDRVWLHWPDPNAKFNLQYDLWLAFNGNSDGFLDWLARLAVLRIERQLFPSEPRVAKDG